MILLKTFKNVLSRKSILSGITFLSVISISCASESHFVLTLKKDQLKREKLNLEDLANLSQGHIVKKEGVYTLNSSLKIVSELPLLLSTSLFIGGWDLTVDCPEITFENFVIKSFQRPTSAERAKASGSVLFLNTLNQEEKPMRLMGKLETYLLGQDETHGGSIQFPANAHFELELAYDLRGGAEGGESGELLYSLAGTRIDREQAYPYEPEGVESVNVSAQQLFFESAAL